MVRSSAKPAVRTLQQMMMTMTGLFRMAWIQSKFSNIVVRSFQWSGLTDPLGRLKLRGAARCRLGQFPVGRVRGDVAVGAHRLQELAPGLVNGSHARNGRQPERVPAVHRLGGAEVPADGVVQLLLLLEAAPDAELELGVEGRVGPGVQRPFELDLRLGE